MNILVIYATTEGQTRKVANFVATRLKSLDNAVVVKQATDYQDGFSIEEFDGIILAGSVHEKRHQDVLGSFIVAHREAIAERKSLFLSVSLAAAFEESKGEAEEYVKSFCEELRWHPDSHVLVAGAIKHAAYGYYQEMIVTHNVLPENAVENPDEDHEFTDWAALEAALADFAGG